MSYTSSRYAKHIARKEIIHIVSELVRKNTVNPPGNEYRVKDIITRRMKALGMKVSYHEKKSGRLNIVGTIGKGKKSIAFVSHMDTVPPGDRELWHTDPFTPTLKKGRIYGRGTLDDKGSFACAYSACKAFIAEHLHFDGRIILIAAADEELGSSLGIIYLLNEGLVRFDAAIIPDGGKMNLSIYGEKGVCWIQVTSTGVQAHGSTPALGKNAIEPLAAFVDALKELRLPKKFHPAFDGWTMNVGTITGGIAANVVPAKTEAVIDFRLPQGITSHDVLKALQRIVTQVKKRYPYAKLTLQIQHETQPHIVSLDSEIAQSFHKAAKKLRIPMKYKTFGGNTVAKNLYEKGIPSVVHYPGNDALAHVPNEYVVIDELIQGSILYAETLAQYFGL
ncbi:MAG: hypothetical protein A3B74_00270 [Candidatus Kerfeldbacteria bacterium RIFCSPHIGHO2_02_FULL_42_14]|uniref:Probable succinyl-diaminopimelate desuccinylase n=1 Tax=Candidatus Kerfeldbacteria bacterium RIFCSPHIGHO2_02_FULL_42_14 TaxID=1798540 RepID=A0A1G2AQU1_9BACT|nr:MAG: hypothetical protein A3B74_00270 [Candidatus Kerfeldbacteria bacterium RIFCSPHIGHO2_02_FULL_42_14]OGY81289.1 MAG: hypothetical protein A3E60_02460 [Candidatus Kerfeldbacteria bacterium RIFCSPHIGHO2_12_FULL_42_13]OGY83564.1 MAG: hypothetical protein A3I91_02895 [Candidatus Kerfeldbacteria bacterium RIFCSPLOWO2_02_FULL_42_19]OGY86720.1 MAG: hypothetical protein A3G01_00725 [Candidatus Kerfeldbacteria bacterium RIFCSPLOWO2_12_FULL_43_9]